VARKGIPVIQSAVELVSVGKAYVRSDNTAKTSRYNLINIGLSANHAVGAGLLTGYVRIDNVTDKLYAASTIGDQAFARYFEPGAPRNWLLGLKYSVAL
jgi:iron complex outermembrane receptor protein